MATTTQSDALSDLWRSSSDLYDRFGMRLPDTKAQLRCFAEECFEFTEATLDKQSNTQDVIDEAADVIVTVMGALMSRAVALEELQFAMRRVAAKNNAKTHETHYVNDATGKITRRGK